MKNKTEEYSIYILLIYSSLVIFTTYVKHFTYSFILLCTVSSYSGSFMLTKSEQVLKLEVFVQTGHPGYFQGSTLYSPHQLHYLLLTLGCSCSPLPSPKNGCIQNPTPRFMLLWPTLECKCKGLPSAERFTSLSMHYSYTGIISLNTKPKPP